MSIWSACCSHAVGGQNNFIQRFSAKKIFECVRWDVDSVGNEAGDQLVACEQTLNDIVVTVHFARTAIAEMRAHLRAGCDRAVDFLLARIGMTERNDCAFFRNLRCKCVASIPFGSERDDADISAGGILQALKFGQIGRLHLLCRMCYVKTGLWSQIQAFYLLTCNSFGEIRIGCYNLLEHIVLYNY